MPEMCINLAERFGRRYKITFDPAYDVRHVSKAKLDPWMMQIPCRSGVIYPFGGERLAVEIDGHSIIAAKLAVFCQKWQDGETEKTFLFDVSEFATVARLVRPKLRRVLTPEQKERLAEFGSQTRFKRSRG